MASKTETITTFTCDRCDFEDRNNVSWTKLGSVQGIPNGDYNADLCHRCAEAFRTWFRSGMPGGVTTQEEVAGS